MSLFINEVVEENARLKEEYKQLLEKYETLGEEWSNLLDDKILYSNLLQKHIKIITALKRELNFEFLNNYKVRIDDDSSWDILIISLDKKEYEILKEVLGNE